MINGKGTIANLNPTGYKPKAVTIGTSSAQVIMMPINRLEVPALLGLLGHRVIDAYEDGRVLIAML
jgi:hypothetical protein